VFGEDLTGCGKANISINSLDIENRAQNMAGREGSDFSDGSYLEVLNWAVENTLLKLIYLISIFSHSASENFVAY
jgi:hypothetical protein